MKTRTIEDCKRAYRAGYKAARRDIEASIINDVTGHRTLVLDGTCWVKLRWVKDALSGVTAKIQEKEK